MTKKSYLRYMETNKEKGKEVQGTEIQTKTVEGNERKQAISVTYTLRAFGENVKKLYELKLLTREEAEAGLKLVAAARNQYLGGEIKLD